MKLNTTELFSRSHQLHIMILIYHRNSKWFHPLQERINLCSVCLKLEKNQQANLAPQKSWSYLYWQL